MGIDLPPENSIIPRLTPLPRQISKTLISQMAVWCVSTNRPNLSAYSLKGSDPLHLLGRLRALRCSAVGLWMSPHLPNSSLVGSWSRSKPCSSAGVEFQKPKLCMKVNPTITSLYLSTSSTSFVSLFVREMMLLIPRASLCCHKCIGPRPQPHVPHGLHCTKPWRLSH